MALFLNLLICRVLNSYLFQFFSPSSYSFFRHHLLITPFSCSPHRRLLLPGSAAKRFITVSIVLSLPFPNTHIVFFLSVVFRLFSPHFSNMHLLLLSLFLHAVSLSFSYSITRIHCFLPCSIRSLQCCTMQPLLLAVSFLYSPLTFLTCFPSNTFSL